MRFEVRDKKLLDIIERMNKSNEALTIIGLEVKNFVTRTFITEGQELLGHKWKPLSQKTIDMRRKGKDGSKPPLILSDTRIAKRSITFEVSGNTVYVGFPPNTSVYMIKHQKGDGVSRRQVLGLNDKLRKNIDKALTNLVQDILK